MSVENKQWSPMLESDVLLFHNVNAARSFAEVMISSEAESFFFGTETKPWKPFWWFAEMSDTVLLTGKKKDLHE